MTVSGSTQQRLPLTGLRVIELGTMTAAPACTRVLALLGAEVVKVEPPGGEPCRHLALQVDGDSYLFHNNNTNKRSVVLDLKAPGSLPRFARLLEQADVLVDNISPDTLNAWGLDLATIRSWNPRLIHCSITGFGRGNPRTGKRAYDMVIQAESGMMSLTGPPDGPPTKVGPSVSDFSAALYAVFTILSALRERRRTGQGRHLDVAMYDVSTWLTQQQWAPVLVGDAPPRLGNRSAGAVATDLHRCQDGYVALSPDAASQAKLDELLAAAGQTMADWCLGQTTAVLVETCRRLGCVAVVMPELDQLAESAHLVQRGMLTLVERSGQVIKLLGSVLGPQLTHTQLEPAPRLGQDNARYFKD